MSPTMRRVMDTTRASAVAFGVHPSVVWILATGLINRDREHNG